MDKIPLYVAGYPKSGTTWLTWLLGDLLNSPTGGSTPGQDVLEIATEGQGRPGKYVVRKGHFVLINDDQVTPSGRAVPEPHRLNPTYLGDSPIVFVVRDPRDIVVSAAHYYRQSVDEIITWMAHGAGSLRAMGPYARYIEHWFENALSLKAEVVFYEDLLLRPVVELTKLCQYFGFEMVNHPREVVARQSFESRQEIARTRGDDMPLGKKFNEHFLHKGQSGAWTHGLTKAQGKRIEGLFGMTMDTLAYCRLPNWWEGLPE